MTRSLLYLLFTGVTLAQTQTTLVSYNPPISDQLKSYLKLTDDQVTQIDTINNDFGIFTQSRLEHQVQLYLEIAVQTAKPVPDPQELGVRYAELEAIRRELDTQAGETRTKTVAILSDSQKELLQALDRAMRLGAEISDAQCQNLLGPAPPVVITRSDPSGSSSSGSNSNTTGGVIGGCGARWFSVPTFIQPASRPRQS